MPFSNVQISHQTSPADLHTFSNKDTHSTVTVFDNILKSEGNEQAALTKLMDASRNLTVSQQLQKLFNCEVCYSQKQSLISNVYCAKALLNTPTKSEDAYNLTKDCLRKVLESATYEAIKNLQFIEGHPTSHLTLTLDKNTKLEFPVEAIVYLVKIAEEHTALKDKINIVIEKAIPPGSARDLQNAIQAMSPEDALQMLHEIEAAASRPSLNPFAPAYRIETKQHSFRDAIVNHQEIQSLMAEIEKREDIQNAIKEFDDIALRVATTHSLLDAVKIVQSELTKTPPTELPRSTAPIENHLANKNLIDLIKGKHLTKSDLITLQEGLVAALLDKTDVTVTLATDTPNRPPLEKLIKRGDVSALYSECISDDLWGDAISEENRQFLESLVLNATAVEHTEDTPGTSSPTTPLDNFLASVKTLPEEKLYELTETLFNAMTSKSGGIAFSWAESNTFTVDNSNLSRIYFACRENTHWGTLPDMGTKLVLDTAFDI